VGLLEGVGADHGARHLARDHYHWNGIRVGGGNAGDGVGGTGAGGHHDHTSLAGGPGVAVGHVGGGLLVADQDMGHVVLTEQRIVNVQEGTARVPVNVLNALVPQSANDHFSAG